MAEGGVRGFSIFVFTRIAVNAGLGRASALPAARVGSSVSYSPLIRSAHLYMQPTGTSHHGTHKSGSLSVTCAGSAGNIAGCSGSLIYRCCVVY